ncbi:MAG: PEP-CTERM sorting domain-containing protein [Kiritimatiellae bacterium]|nr:PEP-CTERM sorting domain-containing protein [Kiritimatiellia bacterium]
MLAFFASAGSVRAETEGDFLLMWQVDDPMVSLVGGDKTYLHDFINSSDHNSSLWGVQVSVYDDSGFVDYLNIWQNGQPAEAQGVLLDSTFRAGPTYAGMGSYVYKGTGNEYTSGSYVFALEIGYYDAADNFVSQAKSDSWHYSDFVSNAPMDPDNPGHRLSFIQSSELQIPAAVPWTGFAYSAPEPSSGMLILIGTALLALRRRRSLNGEGDA